ncbi:MAG: hypothetical protein EP338_09560 [Bacteroidetes bacterium]|nr:MAG: hypothetical protein EP338_09560 [Bacteroidota bacterium]
MKKRSFVTILLGVLMLFSACKKENEAPKFHYEYFGLTKGRFIEYDVVEIRHDEDLALHDTSYYRLKTVIGDTVIDNSGRIAREFFRYKYDTLQQTYLLQDLWTAIIDQGRAELVEENQRIIKLVFAPSRFKEWDVNAFNSYPSNYAYYEDIHDPYELNGLSFDSTLMVRQDSAFNLVEYRQRYEVYAKGVGLIKKHDQELRIENFDKKNPLKGQEYFFTIVNFGFE